MISWEFTLASDQLAIALELVETDSSIYDWDTGLEQTIDPAPDTNLPDPFTVATVSNLQATSGENQLFIQADGTIISRIQVTWTHAQQTAIADFEIAWKPTAIGVWHEGRVRTGLYYIAPVQDGEPYDIRVRAYNNLGIRSAYSTITGHTVVGKTSPPPDVDYFLVQRQADGTREFSWTYTSPPIDLAGFKIRYSLGTGGAWDSMQALHTGLLNASPFETNLLAAGTYTVGIKAVDTFGNESTNAAIIESTLGDPRLKNVIYTEDLRVNTWSGTKTDCAFDPSAQALIPGSTDTWSDYSGSDWSDLSGVAWNENPVTQMVYDHTTIDLGVVVSFKPLVSLEIAAGQVTIEEAHSDDDATYSSYAAVSGQITACYLKLRITVDDPALTGITQCTVNLDADTVYEVIEDLDTSTVSSPDGDFRLPIQKTYIKIFNVNLALQNVGAGWSWEVIDKNAGSGPRIKIYDETNTLADAAIDAEIKGV